VQKVLRPPHYNHRAPKNSKPTEPLARRVPSLFSVLRKQGLTSSAPKGPKFIAGGGSPGRVTFQDRKPQPGDSNSTAQTAIRFNTAAQRRCELDERCAPGNPAHCS
jgi:hypothetical protein